MHTFCFTSVSGCANTFFLTNCPSLSITALLGPGICFLVMPLLQDSTRIVISCLILSMMFMGAQTGGDLPIIPEMAPQIIGTVYGFSNTIACACGFFSPTLTAFILADKVSTIRWIIAIFNSTIIHRIESNDAIFGLPIIWFNNCLQEYLFCIIN